MENILITTGVVVLISAILGIILTIADKYFNNYGEVKITINKDEVITIDGGQTLLSSLTSNKIFIPSACGGKGSCGYCKCKVHDGAGPVLATEKPWLSEEEIANDVRLACQVKVKNDMAIEIPEELFNVKEYTTRLVEKVNMTDRIVKIRLELPEDQVMDFKPGQYIQLKTKPYKKGDGYEGSNEEVFRAYSIASSIRDNHFIELLIGYTQGIATTYVHKILEVGDEVVINGPYGDFYYRDDDNENIIMAATGTGFAPIRSILHHMRDNNIQKPAKFYFGTNSAKDLFLLDEVKMFEDDLNFEFIPSLSHPQEEDNWTGAVGYINPHIQEDVDPESTYTAYLCGSPVVVNGVKKDLMDLNVKEEDILFDDF